MAARVYASKRMSVAVANRCLPIDRPLSAHNVLASAGVLRKLSKEGSGNCASDHIGCELLLDHRPLRQKSSYKVFHTREAARVESRRASCSSMRWRPRWYPIAVIRTHLCSNEKSSFSRFDCCRDFCVPRCG